MCEYPWITARFQDRPLLTRQSSSGCSQPVSERSVIVPSAERGVLASLVCRVRTVIVVASPTKSALWCEDNPGLNLVTVVRASVCEDSTRLEHHEPARMDHVTSATSKTRRKEGTKVSQHATIWLASV